MGLTMELFDLRNAPSILLALAVSVNLSAPPTRVLGLAIFEDPDLKAGLALAFESRLTPGDGTLRCLHRRDMVFEHAALAALTTIRLRLGVLRWYLKSNDLKHPNEKAPQAKNLPWLHDLRHDVTLKVVPSVMSTGGMSGR